MGSASLIDCSVCFITALYSLVDPLFKVLKKGKRMILKWFLISIFCLAGAVAEIGLFCEKKYEDWQICRTCKNENIECPQNPDTCYCENIKVKNPRTEKLIGGPDHCDKEKNPNGGWCYVSQNSKCSDSESQDGYDAYAYSLPDIWHNDKIFRSKEACNSDNIGNALDPRNQKVMEGIKITGNELFQPVVERVGKGKKAKLVTKYNEFEQIYFWMDTAEECREECEARCGMCGAWNYNIDDGECKLHTVDACCGQKGNEVASSSHISGYVCTKCWSTEAGTDCHCSVEERQKGPVGCSGIAQNGQTGTGSGQYGNHTSATGSLEVQEVNNFKRDPCKLVLATIRGKKRWIKRPCNDKEKNPCGPCKDVRRCRIPRRKNCKCRKFKKLPHCSG